MTAIHNAVLVILCFFWLDRHLLAWGTPELTVFSNADQKKHANFRKSLEGLSPTCFGEQTTDANFGASGRK